MTVLEGFENHLKETPNRIALIYKPDERVTFADLWELSGRLYAWLKLKEISAEDIVMYCLPRGVALYACMLGTLRAGAAFVLTETGNDSRRTDYIRTDCGCKFFVDTACWNEVIKCEPLEGYEEIDLHSLCYIAYTSGTTGNPKGVLHEYGSLENAWKSLRMNGRMLFSPDDNFLVMSPMNFVSLPIIFAFSCVFGNCVSIMPYNYSESKDSLDRYLKEAGVNCGYVTPSFLRKHLPFEYPWRVCILSSEPADGLCIPDAACYNGYASTESGCILALYELTAPMSPAPVGKSQSDIELFVLNEDEKEAGPDKTGEICYRNPYVRGYLNLPDRTGKLIRNGLFHTGDEGILTKDGDLIVCGRLDEMFKINGYRIEPNEVEEAVREVSPLKNMVVRGFVYKDVSAIIVFYTDDTLVDLVAITEKLHELLPEYMIPTNYVHIREFPLLETGKLDKLSLLPPEGSWDDLHRDTSSTLQMIGKGRTATVFSFGADKLLKIFHPSVSLAVIQQELVLTQAAHTTGIPVPDAYEIVRSADVYGIVMDKLDGTDLERLIRENPTECESYIRRFTAAVKNMHQTTVEDSRIPDIRETSILLTDQLDDSYFSPAEKRKLKTIFERIPDAATFVHGDCHPGNMMDVNGSLYLIDLTLSGKGHPVFDHLCMYSHYVFLPSLDSEGKCIAQLGMSLAQAKKVFDLYLNSYYPDKSEVELDEIRKQIMCVHAARICLASVVLPGAFSKEVLQTAKLRAIQYIDSEDRMLFS